MTCYKFHLGEDFDLNEALKEVKETLADVFVGTHNVKDRDGNIAPRADVYERQEDFVIEIELPGVNKGDIKLRLADGNLSIEAPREVAKHENVTYYKSERISGKFRRVIELPNSIDHAKIEASFEAGVLVVTIQKREETKPRDIEINL